jgi:hypothetical protein
MIIGSIAFAKTKGKHMPSLYMAFCRDKLVYWILDMGDWPDCALNALVCLYTRHSKRSAFFKARRAEILYIGLDYLISRQPMAIKSGKINIIRLVQL